MKNQISLSRKFFLYSLISIFLVFAGLCYILIKEISGKNKQAILDLSSEALIVESIFNSYEEYASLVLNKMIGEIAKDPNSKNHVNNVLRSFRILYDDKIGDMLSISMFSWVNKNNILVINSEVGVLNKGVNLGNRDYLQLTKKDPNKLYLGKPVTGAVSDQYIIPAGMGFFDKGNNYQGSVVMGFAVKSIYQKLLKSRIVDNSNLQIIYKNEFDVMTNTINSNQKYLAKINLENPNIQILKYPSILGSSLILVYKKISGSPYGILVSFNNFNQFSLIKKSHLPEFISTLLLLAILIYLLKRNFINPITFLSQQAELIGLGSTDIKIPESKISEINQLSRALLSIKDFIVREDLLRTDLIAAEKNINEANQIIHLQEQKHLKDRANSLKNLAGSIAHELRNPLNAINIAASQLSPIITKIDESSSNNVTAKKEITELEFAISSSISQANIIINIILADLSEKPILADDFKLLSAAAFLPEIIANFGYSSILEKEKVKISISKGDDFIFRSIPERFTFIIYNLLKNALYYLDQFPDSVVTIGTERRLINEREYNAIYVHDTGPGVPPEIVPKLFDDFFTAGKKEGTGLGLAFCKRNMQVFDGDIICESCYGHGENGWTKFSLLFPILSEEEVKAAETVVKQRKILIVDDKEVNLLTAKANLERAFPHLACDVAISGKEAIKMVRHNKYHLILMDIEMPDINGIETAKKIRAYDNDVLIIAFTSLDKKTFLTVAAEAVSRKEFNYYLNKSLNKAQDHRLYRVVSKWLMDPPDDLEYMGPKDDYLKILEGKKIVLADDQKINRLMIKRSLESAGLIVTEANDGKELVEIYQQSLDVQGRSDFDIILTDINMPPYNGDESAKQIRAIETINHISHHDEIPIIALSGDGEKEDIHHFFNCQMTDYFIKGSQPDLLLKIMANYVGKDELKVEFKIAADDLTSAALESLKNLDRSLIEHFSAEDQAVILKMFVRDTDVLMRKISEDAKADDTKTLLFHIHSIKGTAANIGAERLFNYVKIIEPKITANNVPPNWVEEMRQIYSDLRNEIQVLLS